MKEVKIGNQIWSTKNLEIDDGGEGIYHHKGRVYYTYDAAVRVAKSVKGWHLPTKEEFKELWRNTDFKTLTNESGFSAFPIGYSDYYGGFLDLGLDAFFWSATEYNELSAYVMDLDFYHEDAYVSYNDKRDAQSIRLIKD